MNKIVISLALAVLSVGCSNAAFVTDTDAGSDALMTVDGGIDPMPDAADASDAAVAPDTSTPEEDATVDPLCTTHPTCCPSGQPVPEYTACSIPGVPSSAQPYCNAAGACVVTYPQECTVANACCDGWRAITPQATECHCIPTYERDGSYWGCDQDQEVQHPDQGNRVGFCVQARCVTHAPPYPAPW